MDGHYEIEMENKKYPIAIHLKHPMILRKNKSRNRL